MPATRAIGIATPANGSPSSNCPTSEGTTSSANPVAASPTAASTRAFFMISASGAVAVQIGTATVRDHYCFAATFGSGSSL